MRLIRLRGRSRYAATVGLRPDATEVIADRPTGWMPAFTGMTSIGFGRPIEARTRRRCT